MCGRGRRHVVVARWRRAGASTASVSPLPRRDFHQGADEKPHHVMQKAIRLDLEHESAVAIAPRGRLHEAAMGVAFRRGAANRERDEAVIADQATSSPARAARDRARARAATRCGGGTAIALRRQFPRSSCIGERARCMRAWKSGRISCAAATQMSRGSSAFSARLKFAADHRSGTRTPTAWPRACTPASVRPAPRAAT